jgi:hypothetical protein
MSTAFFDAKIDFKPLNDEASHLEKLRQRVTCEGWPKDTQDAWIILTAMAASIERCYSGAERILKNLLQELDGSIPSSHDWHRQLIERAASIGPHGRPPLFNEALSKTFHDLRSFRHRERNAYMHDLDPAIVLEKAAAMVKAVHSLGECIDRNNQQEYPSHVSTGAVSQGDGRKPIVNESNIQENSEICEDCNMVPCICGSGGRSGATRQRA